MLRGAGRPSPLTGSYSRQVCSLRQVRDTMPHIPACLLSAGNKKRRRKGSVLKGMMIRYFTVILTMVIAPPPSWAVQVITQVPFPVAFTLPFLLTVATFLLLLVHLTR